MTLLDVSEQGRVLEVSQGYRVNQNCLQTDVSPNFCKNIFLFFIRCAHFSFLAFQCRTVQ